MEIVPTQATSNNPILIYVQIPPEFHVTKDTPSAYEHVAAVARLANGYNAGLIHSRQDISPMAHAAEDLASGKNPYCARRETSLPFRSLKALRRAAESQGWGDQVDALVGEENLKLLEENVDRRVYIYTYEVVKLDKPTLAFT